MRLVSFNVENLFDRAKAMQLDTWDDGREVLQAFAALNALLGREKYTTSVKNRMTALMEELGLEKSDQGPFVTLRRNRGNLLKRPKSGGLEITADGRADWVGSLELRDAPVNERAMRNTARVMAGVQADILAVVEAESRPSLADFNTQIIPAVGGTPYAHVMLIDGNDSRGIDVGLLTREGFPIGTMRSHVDDRLSNGQYVFSRDCPEFSVATPAGHEIIVLVNHFKSKGYGSKISSDARRKAQAGRVAEIYEALRRQGAEHVAIVGDLNDTPHSDALSPLADGTDLRDIFVHPRFEDGGYPGTYGLCNNSNKIDYLFLSPALFARVEAGGVYRTGMWPGSRPARWQTFDEVTRHEEAASDHAAVWAEIDL